MTALAVLHLAEAGKISLDHEANEYLKGWKIPDNLLTAKSKVTVAELLNHTAGINIGGFPGYSSGNRFRRWRRCFAVSRPHSDQRLQ